MFEGEGFLLVLGDVLGEDCVGLVLRGLGGLVGLIEGVLFLFVFLLFSDYLHLFFYLNFILIVKIPTFLLQYTGFCFGTLHNQPQLTIFNIKIWQCFRIYFQLFLIFFFYHNLLFLGYLFLFLLPFYCLFTLFLFLFLLIDLLGWFCLLCPFFLFYLLVFLSLFLFLFGFFFVILLLFLFIFLRLPECIFISTSLFLY